MHFKNNLDIKANESLRGYFLLAMPSLTDGLFAKSLTYICEHGKTGAMGLIINLPLQLSMFEIFDQLEIASSHSFKDIQVMAGGPVQMDQGFVLHRGTDPLWGSSLEVNDEIFLTSSRDILCAIAEGAGPIDHLTALGYAGWSPGQLEEELAQSSWLTIPGDSEIIFSTPCDRRLSRAAAQLGIDMNLISSQIGNA